jgi:hypothetical protein
VTAEEKSNREVRVQYRGCVQLLLGLLRQSAHHDGPAMMVKTPPLIKLAILVGIIVAALIGTLAIVAVLYAAYDKCGQLCWQGLIQAQRERY